MYALKRIIEDGIYRYKNDHPLDKEQFVEDLVEGYLSLDNQEEDLENSNYELSLQVEDLEIKVEDLEIEVESKEEEISKLKSKIEELDYGEY